MDVVIAFFMGLMIGGTFGVLIIALMIASKGDNDESLS